MRSTILPEHLSERVFLVADRPPAPGDFVLYWMHHAVRGHENPALDVARYVAAHLGLPLLVYFGLSGRHRYNADRHHRFMLEGARDAAEELAALGLRLAVYVPQDPTQPSPLHGLLERSAALIVEDYPAPPFPAWTRRWAQRSPGPVWAVDAFCVQPLRLQGRRYTRAFEFRAASRRAWDARIARPWPEGLPRVCAWERELGFTPIALDPDAIEAAIAAAAIDHTLPPVADTPGGSRAGYARWDSFRRRGLRDYARLRNDAAVAPPAGVSRLSPYLHHGQVSPLRIAREAFAEGGPGAAKFLDELLVWRELAFNFCLHTPDLESPEALPAWARESLARHAADPRPVPADPEAIERGRSGVELWDLAQLSLLRHGELHNNVRMTWGKALALWNAEPGQALAELIEHNHRLALDGNDPNSYGGLLWCLGQFDRPFPPERPISGLLRTRPVEAHAQRLDLERYRQRVLRPNGRRLRVAIVGAGLAGSSAGRALNDQGHEVELFDKARGPGGRASTRRSGDWQFDHGAQYFTVRDPRLRRWLRRWRKTGLVVEWTPRIRVFGDRPQSTAGSVRRWVAVPGMNALVRQLQTDLPVQFGCRIVQLAHEAGSWWLSDEHARQHGPFDRLLLALPPAQAADLLGAGHPLHARLANVAMQPCWALMLGYHEPLDLDFDAAFVNQGPLAWIARNDSKPGRAGPPAWVVHASAAWSARHLEHDAQTVATALEQAFAALLQRPLPPAALVSAHRWRYALGSTETQLGCLRLRDQGLVLAGDWCHGARIEGALLSGQAAAGMLLREASRPA